MLAHARRNAYNPKMKGRKNEFLQDETTKLADFVN